jgi:hypothetical protein
LFPEPGQPASITKCAEEPWLGQVAKVNGHHLDPYGWAADDPVGLQHAVGREVLSYVAFMYAPSQYKATSIACVVLLAYSYSLVRMKRPPKLSPTG